MQGAATYSATKAGLRAFTYALADELRDSNISVGVVSPGPIDTGFIMDNLDEVEDIVFSQPMTAPSRWPMRSEVGTEICMPASSGLLNLVEDIVFYRNRPMSSAEQVPVPTSAKRRS